MRFTFSLIFCILNSTHGFQIFIVYLIISKKRRKILKEKLDILKKKEFFLQIKKSLSIKSESLSHQGSDDENSRQNKRKIKPVDSTDSTINFVQKSLESFQCVFDIKCTLDDVTKGLKKVLSITYSNL